MAASMAGPSLRAAGPDDIYLQAYSLIQEADEYDNSGRIDQAKLRYQDAQKNLAKLQKSYPAYNTRAVEIRMEYVRQKLGLPAQPDASGTNSVPANVRTNDPASAAPKPEITRPARKTPASPTHTQSPRKVSETPAVPEPQGKTASLNLEQKLTVLEADNRMLQAKLREALSARPAAVDPAELAKAQEKVQELEKEKELLKASLAQAEAKAPDAAVHTQLDHAKSDLEATRKKLTESIASIATLTQEKQALQTQLDAKKTEPAPAPVVAENSPNESSGIKALEKERDGLLKKLNDANKELYDIKARGQLARFETLTNQLANLRARVEVFEARKVPYTPEELALMDKNVTALDSSVSAKEGKKSIRELPEGAAEFVRRARNAFSAQNYPEAEANYQEVVKLDESNPDSLANLAAIQLEMEKLGDAEANLKKALAASPDDARALSLLGMLRFRQEKYDEALDILSRSAQLDPKNPETQNYLGITLSQKGQRDAAETALRKAILLQPSYGGAHHNLAVIYAHERPPAVALARYHYKKSLSLGEPASPELEKILDLDKTAVTSSR
jgi:tetratricopeptide (TPR) repeat protein